MAAGDAINYIVAEGLSMSHSPRIHDGVFWSLDVGRGSTLQTCRRGDVAFCAGFLRGLRLDDEVAHPKAVPWCGVFINDLRTGDIAGVM